MRQPFNGDYILACADRVLKEKEAKDFKSRFVRKAKSDLRAYLDIKAKREAELEELYTRPYEDIAVEEFLEKLPGPQVEEILEPEVDISMETSDATAETAHPPQGETADSAEVETPDVPMQTEAPEGSPQGEGSGVKAEDTEGSPLGEKLESKDEHMDAKEEGSPLGEESMPDISPNDDDDEEILYDQGIWGKCKTVADPEAAKATKDAEAQNEDAFDNLEKSSDKKGLVDTAEYQEFIKDGYRLERKSPLVLLKDQKNGYGYTGFSTQASATSRSIPWASSRCNTWVGVWQLRRMLTKSSTFPRPRSPSRSARCCPSTIVVLNVWTMCSEQAMSAVHLTIGLWPRHRMYERRRWKFTTTFSRR